LSASEEQAFVDQNRQEVELTSSRLINKGSKFLYFCYGHRRAYPQANPADSSRNLRWYYVLTFELHL